MRRRAARAGSSLVEGSIVLLLFLVLFTGILDMGQVLFFHHFLNERVRAGARYAVVHTIDPAAIRNMVAYNSPSAPAGGGQGLFGLDPSMVEVYHYGAGTPEDRVEVAITGFALHFVSPWLAHDFLPRAFRSVMPIESAGAAQ